MVLLGCAVVGVLLTACAVLLFGAQKPGEGNALHAAVEPVIFTESARELKNPKRGFYNIYKVEITDRDTDYLTLVDEYKYDTDTTLTLVEINLHNYRDREISRTGVSNVEMLFRALEAVDKQVIVRFLYDWDGETSGQEPDDLDTILTHMDQLEATLRRHSRQIFVLQGLFTGNWGEMSGTKYSSRQQLRQLAVQLASVTNDSTYLSVRAPAQWRVITQLEDPADLSSNPLAQRIGLFNDGMLGNESDFGTYAAADVEQTEDFPVWERSKELAFQDTLCRQVPNGGEVIVDNPYNDFENAVRDMAAMHVTYLNQEYDQTVFDKWAQARVSEPGCFAGLDGLTYIERHLGYRLLISDTDFICNRFKNRLCVDIALKNVGFAPLYREPEVKLVLCDEQGNRLKAFDLPQRLRELSGGNDAEEELTLHADIGLGEFQAGEYTLYFSIVDPDTGSYILLANEQDVERYGYCLARISLE